MYHYDHLAYGEIHWRVQNDILYNQQNSITGLELHIDYTDVPDEDFQSNRSGTYGRADVYKDTPNGITYLWEVKPPSYRDKNKSKGLDQINRYVNNGYGNFDFGSNSLGSVNESEFQFHLTLDCSNGVDSWIEEATYTVSYELLEKKQKVNEGEVPQYFIEDSHPPIIDPQEFELVQAEIARHKEIGKVYSSSNIFSTKLVCSCCGGFFGSKVWHSTSKYRRVIWQCNHKFQNGEKCKTPHLYEDEIKKRFIEVCNRIAANKENFVASCRQIVEMLSDTAAIDRKIEELYI